MSKVSNALPLTIPLNIPAYWSPEQAPGGHLLVAKEKAYRCSFGLLLRRHRWRREPRPQWVPIWSYGYSSVL
jgi:hypothetical protein